MEVKHIPSLKQFGCYVVTGLAAGVVAGLVVFLAAYLALVEPWQILYLSGSVVLIIACLFFFASLGVATLKLWRRLWRLFKDMYGKIKSRFRALYKEMVYRWRTCLR